MIPFLNYVHIHEELAHVGHDVDECVRCAPGHVCVPGPGSVSEPVGHWSSQQYVTVKMQSQPRELTAQTL